jgi:hypothetical protein
VSGEAARFFGKLAPMCGCDRLRHRPARGMR